MSHILLGTQDLRLRSTGDAAGGHAGSLALTRERPTRARVNAENFAYYALAAYWGPEARISLDPDELVGVF